MSPSPTRNLPLHSHLSHILTRTDKNIAQLQRVISTPSGLDASLSTISFLSLLIASLTPTSSKAITTTPKLSSSRTHLSPQKLYSIISTARMFLRLLTPPAIWTGASSLFDSPPRDTSLFLLAYAQALANLFYQILESSAYLASEKIIIGKGWGTKSQNKWWVWSSRFWAGYIVLDALRLVRERGLEGRGEEEVEKRGEEEVVGEKVGAGAGQDKVVTPSSSSSSSSSSSVAWWEAMVVNLAWAPLAVHWGMEEGLVNEKVVGLLGTVASGLSLRKAWREKAV